METGIIINPSLLRNSVLSGQRVDKNLLIGFMPDRDFSLGYKLFKKTQDGKYDSGWSTRDCEPLMNSLS